MNNRRKEENEQRITGERTKEIKNNRRKEERRLKITEGMKKRDKEYLKQERNMNK